LYPVELILLVIDVEEKLFIAEGEKDGLGQFLIFSVGVKVVNEILVDPL
jgi:hypothetical protein